jgi:hypothetical protein
MPDIVAEIREALATRAWAPTIPFTTRLGTLRRLLQERVNRLHPGPALVPRLPIVFGLGLDDLALILPPSEHQLLAHLRARKPLRALVGTPGFHNVSRLNERLQRLLSRVQGYCGSAVQHRLMATFDRPGHHHRRRPGRPRRLRPRDDFPVLRVWAPWWFAVTKGFMVEVSEGPASREERRRVARRLPQVNGIQTGTGIAASA